MFAQEFIRNALLAGTPIALACGAVGYFVVLRARCSPATRSATSPSPAPSPRRSPASTCGSASSPRPSRSRCCSRRSANALRADDVAIGVVFVWVLGLGVLLPRPLQPRHRRRQRHHRRAHARSARSSASAPARRDVAALIAARRPRGIARDRAAAPVRDDRPAGRRCPRRAGRRCSARASSSCSASTPPRRPRPSARCCCSACSPPRPAPRIRLTASPLPRRSPSPACFALASIWIGITAAYLISVAAAEQRDHRRRVAIYLPHTLTTTARDARSA